ncbi:MAG: methyl-accepting chemotaxis protein [Leptospiraceae bacterium]|nr:methyl-accepting chemotaxis protein [Leptospiraceae bacterium]
MFRILKSPFQWLNKTSASTRLMVLVILLIVSLAYQDFSIVYRDYSEIQDAQREEEGIHLMRSVSKLMRSIQFERGAAAVYRRTGDPLFKARLDEHFGGTDSVLKSSDDLWKNTSLQQSKKSYQAVRETMREVRTSAAPSAEIYETLDRQLYGLLEEVLYESRLILDPDPVRIYLILAAFQVIPEQSDLALEMSEILTVAVEEGGLSAASSRRLVAVQARLDAASKRLKEKLEKINRQSGVLQKKLKEPVDRYEGSYEAIKELLRDDDAFGEAGRLTTAVENLVGAERALQEAILEELEKELGREVDALWQEIIATGIIAALVTLLALGLSFSIVAGIRRSISEAKGLAAAIATGELSQRITSHGKDELGQLMHSLNEMADNLSELIGRIRNTSERITASSQDLAASSEEFSSTSEEQAAAVEEVSATAEELSATAAKVSDATKKAVESVKKIRHHVDHLVESNMLVMQALNELSQSSQMAAEKADFNQGEITEATAAMQQIEQATRKIADFVAIITEISERTNLLSLNAAIEAARAGDAGRGFAVVAGEITRLADQTQQSAREVEQSIDETLGSIQNGVRRVHSVSENMNIILNEVQNIDAQVKSIEGSASQHSDNVTGITESAQTVQSVIGEIHTGADEQRRATDEVERTMEDINRSSQSVSAGAGNLANLAGDLNHLAETMLADVQKFHLDDK